MVNQSVEIIPGIFEKDTVGIKQKIDQVQQLVKWVQVDIADGKLVPNTTSFTPDELKPLISPPLQYELHMMVQNPFEVAESWIDAGFKRLLAHIEALKKLRVTSYKLQVKVKIQKLREKAQIGLALDVQTQVEEVIEYLDLVDCILVMTVKAGFSGQAFIPEMLKKVKQLRALKPYLPIEVDGGINEDTAPDAIKAGANRLVSTSYLFNAPSIEKAIWTLKNLNY